MVSKVDFKSRLLNPQLEVGSKVDFLNLSGADFKLKKSTFSRVFFPYGATVTLEGQSIRKTSSYTRSVRLNIPSLLIELKNSDVVLIEVIMTYISESFDEVAEKG